MACALACAPAHAQTGSAKTPTALATETNAFFADNMAGGVTPFNTRQTLLDIIASYAAITNIPVFGPGSSTVGHFATWGNTGGTLLVDTAPIAANPVLYGADPTGVADSAPAFTAACAASQFVLFPPGLFKMNSPVTCTSAGLATARSGIYISGSGEDNTVLDWSNSTDGLTINIPFNTGSAHVRSLTFATNQAPGGIALTINMTVLSTLGAATPQSDVSHVNFRGENISKAWSTNLNSINISNLVVDSVFFRGCCAAAGAGIGIDYAGSIPLSSPAVALTVVNSEFISLVTGILYDNWTQGIAVASSNFTSGTNGIVTNPGETPPMGSTLDQLNITNSQFNTATGWAVKLSTLVADVNISNNLIFIESPAIGGVDFVAATLRATLSGNIFQANTGTGVAITSTTAGSGVSMIGNLFSGTTTTGISAGAATDFISIVGNIFNSSGSNIANSSTGTHNFVVNNNGFNPVGISAAVSTGATGATITAGPTNETHYIRQSATFNAAVTKGSQAICTVPSANAPCVVELGPNEAYVVTWATTQPTYTKDVH